MADKTEAIIGAGTTLSFEDPAKSGTYKDLTEAKTIGAVGEQGEFVETTPIAAKTRTYIAGLKTPPDKQITGNDVPGDATQEAFLKLAKDMATVNMKVSYSNGRVGTFAIVLSGWQMNEPQGSDALQWTVYGKQSGDTLWTMVKAA